MIQLEALDSYTDIVYLEVPATKVVLLQAFFELYEGLGTVRTLDLKKSLLCILTTQLDDCLEALRNVQEAVEWRAAEKPTAEERDKYLGYFKDAGSEPRR